MRASLFLTILAPAAGIETVTPTLLDTPADATYPSDVYPRSIWALRAWGGYNLAGTGDSAHNAAAPPVWNTTDGSTWSDTDGVTFADHQIDRFVLTGGKLWIPGHDPTSGTLGNLYTYAGGGTWNKSTPATLSACAHVYDLYHDNTYLWAMVGASSGSNSIRRSSDNGATWSAYKAPATGCDVYPSRSWTAFVIDGTLYASTNYVYYTSPPSWTAYNDPWANTVKWNGSSWETSGVQFAPNDTLQVQYTEVEPEVFEISSVGRIAKAVTFGSRVFYIVGQTVTDHDFSPTNLYSVTAALTPTRLTFMGGAKVHDLLVHNNACYALCNELIGDTYTTTVYVTSDGTNWTGALTFRHSDTYTFARSMAFFDDGGGYDLYFGYACYYDQEGAGAGKIVRTPLTQVILFAGGGGNASPQATLLWRETFDNAPTNLTETDAGGVISFTGGQMRTNGSPNTGSGLVSNATHARTVGRGVGYSLETAPSLTNRIRVTLTSVNTLGATTDDAYIHGNQGFGDAGGEYGVSESTIFRNDTRTWILEDTTGAHVFTRAMADITKPSYMRRMFIPRGATADLYTQVKVATNASVSQTHNLNDLVLADFGADIINGANAQLYNELAVSGTTYTTPFDQIIFLTVTAPTPLSGSVEIRVANVDANNYGSFKLTDAGALTYNNVISGTPGSTTTLNGSAISAGATIRLQIIVGIQARDYQCYITNSSNVTTRQAAAANLAASAALDNGTNAIITATDFTLGNLKIWRGRSDTYYDNLLSQFGDFLLFHGDSLTLGSPGATGTNPFPYQVNFSLWNDGRVTDYRTRALGGRQIREMADEFTARSDAAWISATRAALGLKQFCIVLGGTNDIYYGRTVEQMQTDIQAFCALVRAAGYKVIVGTIAAADGAGYPAGFDTDRTTYNAWLVSNYSGFADGLADIAANAAFDEKADAADTTYYHTDKVHWNNTGHGVVAGIVKAAIDAVSA